jgi:hypothetical protein
MSSFVVPRVAFELSGYTVDTGDHVAFVPAPVVNHYLPETIGIEPSTTRVGRSTRGRRATIIPPEDTAEEDTIARLRNVERYRRYYDLLALQGKDVDTTDEDLPSAMPGIDTRPHRDSKGTGTANMSARLTASIAQIRAAIADI